MIRSLFGCVFLLAVMGGAFISVGTGYAAEGPVARTRQLLGFGEQVPLDVEAGRISLDRATRIASLPASDKEFNTSITPANGTTAAFTRGSSMTLNAELLSGDGVGLAVCFADANGMEFGTGNLPLKPGRNALTWAVPTVVAHHWGAASDGTIHGAVRITRVLLIRWPSATTATVRLDGIDVTETISLADMVTVAMRPDAPVPVVAPGSTDARIVLTSSHDADAKLSWKLIATTADGVEVIDERPLVLPAKGTLELPVPAALTARQGLVRLDWRLADAGGERSGHLRLGVMRLAGHDARFRNLFMFGCSGDAKDAVRQIGIDVLRCSDNFTWGSREGVVYDWSKEVAEAKRAHELGFEISWLTTYTPPWGAIPDSRQGGWVGTRPIRLEVWRDYLRQMLGHLKGYVDYYEIWNEADLDGFYAGDFEHYRQLLTIAHEEIKKADPALKVLTSGWAVCIEHGGRNLNPDIQRRTIAECQDLFDYHAFHQHGDFYRVFQGAVDGELADIRKTLKSPKPLFYTETSMCSGDDWESQMMQGNELIKKVVFAWSRGAMAYEWFTAIDWDERWGLINRANQPKPAYCTYNTVIRTLRGLAPAGQLEGLGKDRWGFAFADPTGKDSRRVYVLWRENETQPDADFRLAVGNGATCTRVDLWGNEQPEVVIEGDIRLQPRSSPVFVVVNGSAATTLVAKPLAVPKPAGGIAPGETFTVAVQVGNPAGAARPVRLSIALPAELHVKRGEPQSATLAAGAMQTLTTAVSVPATAELPNVLTTKLTYVLQDAWQGELSLPLETVRVIPLGDPAGRAPDFVLDQTAHVVNYFGADPANADKLWRGPSDLSAKIWLARQGTSVKVRVDVSDDTHDQPFQGGDSWKGDGLQVAFDVPGQQGWWELGIYRGPDGAGRCHVFRMPEGTGLANPWNLIPVRLMPRADGMFYEIELRDANLGFSEQALAAGIRFNLVVNDSDGKGIRESYIRIANGIGDNKTMTLSPLARFRLR